MKKRNIISAFAIAAIVLLSNAYALDNKTYDQKYNYPIVPGMTMWNDLKGHEDYVQVLQVPQDILDSMTTQALVETTLDYPLLGDIMAFDSLQLGFDTVVSRSNVLQELFSRSDAGTKLLQAYEEIDIIIKGTPAFDDYMLPMFLEIALTQDDIENQLTDQEMDNRDDLIYFNYVLRTEQPEIYGTQFSSAYKLRAQKMIEDGVDAYAYTTYVTTPKGTQVKVWVYGEELTAEQIAANNDYVYNTYRNIVLLAPSTTNYNCHSYAWYSASTNNKYWMEDPSAYVNDGSYSRKTSAGANYKVVYGTDYEHSGIVDSVSGSTIWVTSKWGVWGLVKHELHNNPYTTTIKGYYY